MCVSVSVCFIVFLCVCEYGTLFLFIGASPPYMVRSSVIAPRDQLSCIQRTDPSLIKCQNWQFQMIFIYDVLTEIISKCDSTGNVKQTAATVKPSLTDAPADRNINFLSFWKLQEIYLRASSFFQKLYSK